MNGLDEAFRETPSARKLFNGESIMDFCVFLRDEVKCWPMSAEGKCQTMTNSEIIRTIQKGSVEINNKKPTEFKAPIEWPVTQMVIFPNGKRKTTLI